MQNAYPTARRHQPVNWAESPSLAWFLMLALAMLALALPIVGPLDDHHFAERSHTHEHVYLDGRPAAHDHAGAGGRVHLHLDRVTLPSHAADPADRAVGAPVAYFTDTTASLMLAVMNAPYHNAPESLRPAPPKGSGDSPLASFAPPYREPDTVLLLPPVPPPIA